MSVPSLTDLFRPVTLDEAVESSLSIADQLDMPVTAWQPGSVGREMLYVNAQNLASFSVTTSETARGGSLRYARGGWLTLLAQQLFDVTRIESASATGPIRLTNTSAGPYTFAPGDVRVLNETEQKTYTSAIGGTVASGGTLDLDFVADEPGTASNLVQGDVLSLVTAIPGVTPSWVQDLIGQDEETDAALIVRCEESNAKASPNGPGDAYNFFAKSTLRTDGSNVGVTRTNLISGNGTNYLYIADADGAMSVPDVALVFANVNSQCVPTGFTLVCQSAVTLAIPVSMTLTKARTATASNAELEALVTAAISGYFSGIPVGGAKSANFNGIYRSTLVTLARIACGDNVVDCVLSGPGADVALNPNQVPVISGSIAFAWVNA